MGLFLESTPKNRIMGDQEWDFILWCRPHTSTNLPSSPSAGGSERWAFAAFLPADPEDMGVNQGHSILPR